jgi:type IV pilus assembly protein PilV
VLNGSTPSQGFTLMEVLVAMLIAAMALLGLAASQIRAIQYSQLSLQQTVASIETNNVLERIWPDLCALQGGRTAKNPAGDAFDPTRYQLPALQQIPDLQLTIPNTYVFSNSPYAGATQTFLLQSRWQDSRLAQGESNQLSLKASFPWLRNGNANGC